MHSHKTTNKNAFSLCKTNHHFSDKDTKHNLNHVWFSTFFQNKDWRNKAINLNNFLDRFLKPILQHRWRYVSSVPHSTSALTCNYVSFILRCRRTEEKLRAKVLSCPTSRINPDKHEYTTFLYVYTFCPHETSLCPVKIEISQTLPSEHI